MPLKSRCGFLGAIFVGAFLIVLAQYRSINHQDNCLSSVGSAAEISRDAGYNCVIKSQKHKQIESKAYSAKVHFVSGDRGSFDDIRSVELSGSSVSVDCGVYW